MLAVGVFGFVSVTVKNLKQSPECRCSRFRTDEHPNRPPNSLRRDKPAYRSAANCVVQPYSRFVRYVIKCFTIMNLSNRIDLVLLRPTRFKKERPVPTAAETPGNLGDRWLSVDDIASYLGVKRDTVYKWVDRQNMPAHKVGRLWKFRKDEIDEWILSKSARSGGPRRGPRSHLRHGKTNLKGGK